MGAAPNPGAGAVQITLEQGTAVHGHRHNCKEGSVKDERGRR